MELPEEGLPNCWTCAGQQSWPWEACLLLQQGACLLPASHNTARLVFKHSTTSFFSGWQGTRSYSSQNNRQIHVLAPWQGSGHPAVQLEEDQQAEQQR